MGFALIAALLGVALAPAVTVAGAAGQAWAATATGKVTRKHAGESAPKAVFIDRAGGRHGVADFRGRIVLVNLWATWCAPCLAEMPALARLQSRAGPRLVVLPVSQDLEGWRAIDRFFAPGRLVPLKPYLDRENALPLAYKAAGLPLTVLYDREGREVWRLAGPIDWDKVDVEKLGKL